MSYRALRDLYYPTDPAVLRLLVAGENLPMRGRNMKTVPAGSIVSDIPKASVAVLLAKGWIEEVADGSKV